MTVLEPDPSIRTGWTSGAGENRAHPNPGTSSWRARMRRNAGCSRVTRTSVSGRAVSMVYSSRLISSTGTPSRASVPMTMVMSNPVSSSDIETSVMYVSVSILEPWISPSMPRTVAPSRVIVPGRPARSESTWMSGPGSPAAGTTTSTMPPRSGAQGLTTTGPG